MYIFVYAFVVIFLVIYLTNQFFAPSTLLPGAGASLFHPPPATPLLNDK